MTNAGTITPDRLRSMSGLELLEAMVAGALPAPPIGKLMGFRLVEVEKGRALFEGIPGRACSTRSGRSMAAMRWR